MVPKALLRVNNASGVIAGVLILLVGMMTVADVASRYLLGQSILGVTELSSLLLVAIAYLGLAAAERDGRHVTVSLVEERLGRKQRAALSALRCALIVFVAAVFLFGMYTVLNLSMVRQETTNDIMRIPTWPARLIILVSFGLFFLVAILKEVKRLRNFLVGGDRFMDKSDAEVPPFVDDLEIRE